jgi:glycosyltransferase involved in cell wall biosynthesis
MQKLKIMILGKLPPPYFGPAVATEVILKSKLKEKFNLIHLNTSLNNELNSMGKFALTKILRGFGIYVNYILKIISKSPDLILIPVGQTTGAFLKDSVFILLGRITGGKVLLQLRGSDWKNWLDRSHRLTQWYVKKNLSLASGMIVLGEKLRYLFKDNFPPEKIFVVPNGADYLFQPQDIFNRETIEILFLSNLFSTKGLEDVLQAAVILKERNDRNLHFTFAGEWKNSEFEFKCNQFIERNKLQVEIMPPVSGDQKLKLLTRSDIFVFPPRIPEGHPWVIVEALAAGLPIISTDQGAITESVKDTVNGFIVESNSPGAIAEKILFLINNPGQRIRMANESRRLYEESFTEAKMVERLSGFFKKVLS